jgi:hypothetical protein
MLITVGVLLIIGNNYRVHEKTHRRWIPEPKMTTNMVIEYKNGCRLIMVVDIIYNTCLKYVTVVGLGFRNPVEGSTHSEAIETVVNNSGFPLLNKLFSFMSKVRKYSNINVTLINTKVEKLSGSGVYIKVE